MQDWTDLFVDGRRLNRIIRILEKRMKKTEDDDKVIRYANCICMLTREKVNISNYVLEVKNLIKDGRKLLSTPQNERNSCH